VSLSQNAVGVAAMKAMRMRGDFSDAYDTTTIVKL
jgi:hypothetical protein